MRSDLSSDLPVVREGYLPVGHATLYYREIGHRQPIIVLRGGPDFDRSYLLPDVFRLMQETWGLPDHNLLPQLTQPRIPTLVICEVDGFVPVDCASHIAQAIPVARLVVLKDCGHFSSMARPDQVCRAIDDCFPGSWPTPFTCLCGQ